MDRIGLGTTRIAYGWPSDFVSKVTTLADDHGCKEHFSQKLKEVCSPVLHSGHLIVKMIHDSRDKPELHRGHCLVQTRAYEATDYLETVTEDRRVAWHCDLTAFAVWLGNNALCLKDTCVSNIGISNMSTGQVVFCDHLASGVRRPRGKKRQVSQTGAQS